MRLPRGRLVAERLVRAMRPTRTGAYIPSAVPPPLLPIGQVAGDTAANQFSDEAARPSRPVLSMGLPSGATSDAGRPRPDPGPEQALRSLSFALCLAAALLLAAVSSDPQVLLLGEVGASLVCATVQMLLLQGQFPESSERWAATAVHLADASFAAFLSGICVTTLGRHVFSASQEGVLDVTGALGCGLLLALARCAFSFLLPTTTLGLIPLLQRGALDVAGSWADIELAGRGAGRKATFPRLGCCSHNGRIWVRARNRI